MTFQHQFFTIALISCLLAFSACSLHPIVKNKNIVYDKENGLKLDVFSPKNKQKTKAVLVFIHGGNWNAGKKETYSFFGKGMARKNIVTVVIDYRLSPLATYDGMTSDAANAIAWVQKNIAQYGGDSSKIYVSGHSAGGHLAALVATDTTYFSALKMRNPLKGSILIDAFGLDMLTYLSAKSWDKDVMYYPTFSTNPEIWKKGSPIFHIHKGMPPFLIFIGSNTYPAIKSGAHDFMKVLQSTAPETQLIEKKGRGHIGMIFQFALPWNQAYKEVLHFMKQ
jgi:acetyl esterase/lipase